MYGGRICNAAGHHEAGQVRLPLHAAFLEYRAQLVAHRVRRHAKFSRGIAQAASRSEVLREPLLRRSQSEIFSQKADVVGGERLRRVGKGHKQTRTERLQFHATNSNHEREPLRTIGPLKDKDLISALGRRAARSDRSERAPKLFIDVAVDEAQASARGVDDDVGRAEQRERLGIGEKNGAGRVQYCDAQWKTVEHNATEPPILGVFERNLHDSLPPRAARSLRRTKNSARLAGGVAAVFLVFFWKKSSREPGMSTSMISQENAVYRFSGFVLQPAERRLSRNGKAIALTPKALDTLLLLVERAGHVVSKDELMGALWPGRFVTEANLTKHIWTLRKALGESEEGGRYIETVSKTGYRFVASVKRSDGAPEDSSNVRAASPPEIQPPLSPAAWPSGDVPTDRDKERRLLRGGVAVVALLLIAGAVVAWFEWRGRTGLPETSPRESVATVAIVDFNNLSRNPKDAWIGPAFEEMLGTDIALGGRLHTMPDELVRPAHADLPIPGAGGYSAASLTLLRQRLGTDYVVSGSYLAYGVGDNPPLRLDLALQDARRGVTVATVSRTGTVADLPSLITVADAELRKKMGASARTGDELRLATNAQPPNAEVMRRMGFALDALRRYDPARARDELLQAVARSPGYAPAYALLAKAWSSLGYKQKALAAAEQAAAHSVNLPTPIRLQIEIQRDESRYDWPHAIAGLRQLVLIQREDPETQLDLVDALLAAGKPADAARALSKLRSFDGAAVQGDPRVELAATRIAAAQDDTKTRIAHASHALKLAQARDAPGLMADAERQLGIAGSYSKDRTPADALLERALADYRRVGNPSGEAAVHRDIGNLYIENHPQRAREEYERSLALYQSIGDQNGIASAYSDLAIMLWNAGDADGSKAAVRDILQIRRMTGDIAGQAWALAALAIEESDEAASDAVVAGLRQAASLDASIGAHSHRGFSLLSLSDLLRLRGELAQAATTCAEALAEFAKVSGSGRNPSVDFECALIALDRGDVQAAETGFQQAREAATQEGDSMALGNSDVELAKIHMGNADWQAAAVQVDSATREYARGDMTTGETNALSLAALCNAELGKLKARDAAISRAQMLRSRITERQEVIDADIALAEVRGETGEVEQSVSQLSDIAEDARKRQWQAPALDADLAAVRLLERKGEIARATALRAAIAATAHRLGFGWMLQRLKRR